MPRAQATPSSTTTPRPGELVGPHIAVLADTPFQPAYKWHDRPWPDYNPYVRLGRNNGFVPGYSFTVVPVFPLPTAQQAQAHCVVVGDGVLPASSHIDLTRLDQLLERHTGPFVEEAWSGYLWQASAELSGVFPHLARSRYRVHS